MHTMSVILRCLCSISAVNVQVTHQEAHEYSANFTQAVKPSEQTPTAFKRNVVADGILQSYPAAPDHASPSNPSSPKTPSALSMQFQLWPGTHKRRGLEWKIWVSLHGFPTMHSHDLNESRALWLLALIGCEVIGKPPVFGLQDCLTLAHE